MRRSPELKHLTATLLGVGVALLAAASPASAQLATSAWPMLQYDERHTGRSHLLGPNFPSGAPDPDHDVAVWHGFDRVKSSPTIAPDDTVYVGVGWSVCAIDPEPDSNGVLPYAWDSSAPPPTPQPLCRRLVADASASSAAIGHVTGVGASQKWTMYIGDRGNTLNAFDQDGEPVWRYSHGHEGDVRTSPVIGPESSPGANDGLIYIGFSQNLDGPGSLAAVFPGPPPPLGVGGTLKWSYTGGNFVNTSSPALDNGTVYFGDIIGWFHALDANSGAFRWKVKIGNQISASPVIVPPKKPDGTSMPNKGRIYIGSTNGLSAVDPATHDVDPAFAAVAPPGVTPTPGTFITDGMVDQTPALAADGTIYAASKSAKRKTVYAIKPDGTLKWAFGPVQNDADNAAFIVVSQEGTIYAAMGKTVYALRPVDGTVLWSHTVPMNIISFPAIGGDAEPDTGGTATLYVPSYDGNVYALSSHRGPQNSGNRRPTILSATARKNAMTFNLGADPPIPSMTVAPGESISFSGVASDPDNDPLTLTWDFGDSTPPFAGTSTMHSYSAGGPYVTKLIVKDGVSPEQVVSIKVTVTSPAPILVTDSFDRPDNTNIGSPSGQGPWLEVDGCGSSSTWGCELYTPPSLPPGDQFAIKAFELQISKDNELQAVRAGNHIAVLPSVTGPTQTVGADFASVDNGPVPKFGVILRYQNALNYYVAYRKPGNTSYLRISKVVGGVETPLVQVGLQNPQVNTFFTLSATAAGTTLFLSLNGVPKLSVEDTTFSTGNIGVLLNPGTSTTKMYRVNNFTANVQ